MDEASILKSEWPKLHEQVGHYWKALTAEDLETIDGNFDVLSDLLQERYGYSKALAEDDIKRFIREPRTESMQEDR